MAEGAGRGIAWAGLGCGGLVGWCVWTWLSAAAPLAMAIVNAVAILALVAVVAIPTTRRYGANLARRLAPGAFVIAPAVVALLMFLSGLGLSLLLLLAPPDEADVQPDTGDSTEVDPRPSAGDASPDAGSPTTAAMAPAVEDHTEAEPSTPTEDQLAIDAAFREEVRRHPEEDAFATIARRRSLPRDQVEEATFVVGEYREALADRTRPVLARGVVGRVGPSVNVQPTEHGPNTVISSLTVFGCASGTLPDSDLDFLVRTGVARMAGNLPAEVDALRVALWYEGVSCDRHSLGYQAIWIREGNRLLLR